MAITAIKSPLSELIYAKTNVGGFFFDAFLSMQHQSTVTITQHPVETGAAISDHAYSNPAQLSMQIGMSDVIVPLNDQFGGSSWGQLSLETQTLFNDTWGVENGQARWTQENAANNPVSRSVTAFQILRQLQDSRLPFQIVTRLYTYQNMLVESLIAPEDNTLAFAMKATVTFREIFVATVETVKISARPQTTDDTVTGDAPVVTVVSQSWLKALGNALQGAFPK